MQYSSATPSSPLRFLVKQYWGIEKCLSTKEHVERIIPTGLPVLYFYLADKPVLMQAKQKQELTSHTYLCGQYNQFFDLKITGSLQLFAIVFQPYALPMIFDIPAPVFNNNQISLQEIYPKLAHELSNKIGEAATFAARVNIIETFIKEQLKKKSRYTYLPQLTSSINLLLTESCLQTSQLAQNACLSKKQFERVFQYFIGLPPRKFIQVLRLQKVLLNKQLLPTANLAQVALDAGYFDQSHLNREFKTLTGITPKKYFSICEPHADFFMN